MHSVISFQVALWSTRLMFMEMVRFMERSFRTNLKFPVMTLLEKDQRNISLIILMVVMMVTVYFPVEHRNAETSKGKWQKGARDEGWEGNDGRKSLTGNHVQWQKRKQTGQRVCEMSAIQFSWIQKITQHPSVKLSVATNAWWEGQQPSWIAAWQPIQPLLLTVTEQYQSMAMYSFPAYQRPTELIRGLHPGHGFFLKPVIVGCMEKVRI